MALYESTFIVRQDISAQDADKIAENFYKIVNDNNGSVLKKEYWGLQTLAYKVNKNKKGHYIHFGIDAPSEAVNELNRQYKLSEEVIRYLTIKVTEISKEPSVQMPKKSAARNVNKKDEE